MRMVVEDTEGALLEIWGVELVGFEFEDTFYGNIHCLGLISEFLSSHGECTRRKCIIAHQQGKANRPNKHKSTPGQTQNATANNETQCKSDGISSGFKFDNLANDLRVMC